MGLRGRKTIARAFISRRTARDSNACHGLRRVRGPHALPLDTASRIGRAAAVSQLTRADLSPRSAPALLEGLRTEEGGSFASSLAEASEDGSLRMTREDAKG